MTAAMLADPALTDPRAQQMLGRIAVELPGATALFRRLKLDFCCGGQVPLAEACRDKGLDLQAVLAELAPLERGDGTTAMREPGALIEHIVTRFHEVHREQLPELLRMARRVEAVHRDNPHVPAGLGDLIEQMEGELLDHMAKEEGILFPMMRSGSPMAGQPAGVMRAEHTAHGAMLERLVELTNNHQPPEEACNTWRALYAGTRQFADDLVEHIHLENNVLFPQFEQPAGCGCGSGNC